jgi:hypothetical protein
MTEGPANPAGPLALDARRADHPGLALKIGIAGAIGLGAIVSGLLISRSGRRLVREAWQGRRRTRLEDRVLDSLWGDPHVGRRNFDVQEVEAGTVVLSGTVRSRREKTRALRLAQAVKDVRNVEDRITIEQLPGNERRLAHLRRRMRGRHEDDGDDD